MKDTGLQKYWKKRDFSITSEPRGEVEAAGTHLRFYIQKHHARRLHYDFRLELDGTLKSWAVPKGPSLDPADKRLAVEVEDHPLAYGTFEGEIPSGQYGAGQVLLWDKGTWEPIGDAAEGYKNGSLKFLLHGHKLQGKWALVRMKGRQTDKDDKDAKTNWLLIKEHDQESRTGAKAQITENAAESVSALPDMHALPPTAHTDQPARRIAAKPVTSQHARQPVPHTFKPQLATLASHAPEGEQWLAELKYDGYRALTRIEKGQVSMLTRNGHDWSAKWPGLVKALADLPVDTAWLDGEVVAIAPDGNISFQLLQNAMRLDKEAPLVYFIFDLMYLDGYDLTSLPLIDRKELLQRLLATKDEAKKDKAKQQKANPDKTSKENDDTEKGDKEAQSPLHFSDHVEGHAGEVFRQACLLGQEGVVVKNAQAPYVQQRSAEWLKVKCGMRQEFVVAGYTDPAGSREHFGALLLGTYDHHSEDGKEKGQLRYAGRVGTGFNSESLKMIAGHFRKLHTAKTAFVNPPKGREAIGVHWLKPVLVAEVKFAQWTSEGLVRHASFVGLRADKPAKEITHETALVPEETGKQTRLETGQKKSTRNKQAAAEKSASHTADLTLAASGSGSRIAGIKLSNPAKILYAEDGYTKHDIASYYANIEQWILPYLQDRPLSIVRCPNGYHQACFFQKHVRNDRDSHLQSIQLDPAGKEAEYFIANHLPAIIELVQLGVLELHSWGSRYPVTSLADRLVFDLDPAPGLAWEKVTEAANLLKGLLEEVDLQCFVKTTGGKGLHVEVPIKADYPWDVVKAFTRGIAQYLEDQIPERFTASISKKKREGRLFIDYLRNSSGATAIVPYSTRARAGAPVATPLAWDEVGAGIQANHFNITNIGERLAQLKSDPWQDYLKTRQKLAPKLIKLFTKAD